MFGFFEGVLGELLAPVTGGDQMSLAIQHHRHREMEELMATNSFDARKLAENGVGAIHVACRYNNRHAIDVMLGRGTRFFFASQRA